MSRVMTESTLSVTTDRRAWIPGLLAATASAAGWVLLAVGMTWWLSTGSFAGAVLAGTGGMVTAAAVLGRGGSAALVTYALLTLISTDALSATGYPLLTGFDAVGVVRVGGSSPAVMAVGGALVAVWLSARGRGRHHGARGDSTR